MTVLKNPYRGLGLAPEVLPDVPWPSVDAAQPQALLARCPVAAKTPLTKAPALATQAGVAELWLKDERGRMGLGSFKALGAAYVIADQARAAMASTATAPGQALQGRTFVTASAGNHGLSVAAGARVFGARAVVFIAEAVPEAFARRLADEGAEVRRAGADYAASMLGALGLAEAQGWTLLSDSSWRGYVDLPHRLKRGYLVLPDEIAAQMPEPPSHVFLQAGVGGMAAAVAAYLRQIWGAAPQIIVVEPDRAPALLESIRAGAPVTAPGPASTMGRLDCKDPSLIALKGLARDVDAFVTISDEDAEAALPVLAVAGFATTASGGAGVAALLYGGHREALGLSAESRVLAIISEGPEA